MQIVSASLQTVEDLQILANTKSWLSGRTRVRAKRGAQLFLNLTRYTKPPLSHRGVSMNVSMMTGSRRVAACPAGSDRRREYDLFHPLLLCAFKRRPLGGTSRGRT